MQTDKDEYDASVAEDGMLAFAPGSVFQGLRADIHGYVVLLNGAAFVADSL